MNYVIIFFGSKFGYIEKLCWIQSFRDAGVGDKKKTPNKYPTPPKKAPIRDAEHNLDTGRDALRDGWIDMPAGFQEKGPSL